MTSFGKALVLLIVTGLLLPISALAQPTSVGRIVKTAGIVSAVDTAGNSRPLARGSEFFAGETITTGPDGAVDLRMTDGAVLSMTEDAQFMVNAYQNDGPGGAADTAIMTMVRGALRTVSGTIGDTQGDTYQMNTPYASIGIRGTEYAVRVEANGRTFVFVFDGAVALTPSGGGTPVNLGVGGETDGVEITEDQAVVELALADLPADVQALVQEIIEIVVQEVPQAEIDALPPPDDAIEVQLQQQQQQQQQQLQQQDATVNAAIAQQATGGAFVDADGNALAATTETEIQAAQQVVVVTITRVNPNAFSDETKASASPH